MKFEINVANGFDKTLGIRSIIVKRKSWDRFQFIAAKEIVLFFRFIGCIAVVEELQPNEVVVERLQPDETDSKSQEYQFDADILEQLSAMSEGTSAEDQKYQKANIVIALKGSDYENGQLIPELIKNLEEILDTETRKRILSIYQIWVKYNLFTHIYIFKYYREIPLFPILDEIFNSISIFHSAYMELKDLKSSKNKLTVAYSLVSELNCQKWYTKALYFMFNVFKENTKYKNHTKDELLELDKTFGYIEWDDKTRQKVYEILRLTEDQFYGAYIVAGELSYLMLGTLGYYVKDEDYNWFTKAFNIAPETEIKVFLLQKSHKQLVSSSYDGWIKKANDCTPNSKTAITFGMRKLLKASYDEIARYREAHEADLPPDAYAPLRIDFLKENFLNFYGLFLQSCKNSKNSDMLDPNDRITFMRYCRSLTQLYDKTPTLRHKNDLTFRKSVYKEVCFVLRKYRSHVPVIESLLFKDSPNLNVLKSASPYICGFYYLYSCLEYYCPPTSYDERKRILFSQEDWEKYSKNMKEKYNS